MTNYELASAYVWTKPDLEELNEALSEALQKESALVKLGARTEDPVSEPVSFSMTTMLLVSKDSEASDIQKFMKDQTHLVRSVDSILMIGSHPGGNHEEGPLNKTAILPNAQFGFKGGPEGLDVAIQEFADLVANPTGVVLSKNGFREIAGSASEDGIRKYPLAVPFGSFKLNGLTAVCMKDIFRGDRLQDLAVLGDFSKIFLNVRIESLEQDVAEDGRIKIAVNYKVEFENPMPGNFLTIQSL